MNRRGLKGKVKSLEEIIKEVKPTIVWITETQLAETDTI